MKCSYELAAKFVGIPTNCKDSRDNLVEYFRRKPDCNFIECSAATKLAPRKRILKYKLNGDTNNTLSVNILKETLLLRHVRCQGSSRKLYTSLFASSTWVSSIPCRLWQSRSRIRKWKSCLERDKNGRPSETVSYCRSLETAIRVDSCYIGKTVGMDTSRAHDIVENRSVLLSEEPRYE